MRCCDLCGFSWRVRQTGLLRAADAVAEGVLESCFVAVDSAEGGKRFGDTLAVGAAELGMEMVGSWAAIAALLLENA